MKDAAAMATLPVTAMSDMPGGKGWLTTVADNTRVIATGDGDGFFEFSVVVSGNHRPAGDRSLILRLGASTLVGMKFPADMDRNERRFGPSRVALRSLRWNSDYALWLVDEATGEAAQVPAANLEGDMFEAATIADKPAFLVRIQNNHTKFASPDVLTIGAKSFYHRTEAPELRAACLTILFHRLIWREPDDLAEADFEFLRWLVGQSIKVVEQLQALLASQPATKELVRWTTSLATVAGHGAIIGNDPQRAKDLYAVAGGQADNLPASPVSGMNVVNGAIFSGLFEAAMGDMEAANMQLRAAISTLKAMVAAHNLFANVWVVGDIAEASLGLRQAMIAMVRLGLISNKNEPMIGADDYFDVHQIKSPVGAFLEAGYCRDVWRNLAPIMRPA